jgi:hypothetical protein
MPSASRFDYDICERVKDIKESWGGHKIDDESRSEMPASVLPSLASSFTPCFCLLEKEAAVTVQPNLFFNYHAKLFTKHTGRWNDNGRTGGILKHPDASEFDYEFVIEKTQTEVTEAEAVACKKSSNGKTATRNQLSALKMTRPQIRNTSPAQLFSNTRVSAKELHIMLEKQVQEQKEIVCPRHTLRSICYPVENNMKLRAYLIRVKT